MEPDGISIHAAKLASGYMKLARKLGVKIHPASPVMGWKTVNGVNHLATPGGTVRAKTVALATAGHCATITVFFRTAACRSAAAVP